MGWMILAIVLLVLLGLSVLGNFTQFVSHFAPGRTKMVRSVGPKLDEVYLEDNGAPNKIAVVDIRGIIANQPIGQDGYTVIDLIKAQLKAAKEDRKVKAVILRVDSPGGEVLASDEIYNAVKHFQDSEKGIPGKPVIASMGSLGASGGYYVSSPCQWIVANEMTITGSIGVIMDVWNYRGLMDKIGVRPEVYKSGKFKDMLSGSRSTNEIPAEERAMVQKLIDEVYGKFKNVVAEGRSAAHEKNGSEGKALVENWQTYADGRVLTGSEALKLGFVDELGNFDDTVKRAKKIANVARANLVQYQLRLDISDLFRLFGKTETPVLKVDLGMDLPKLEAGHLYYLWRPEK